VTDLQMTAAPEVLVCNRGRVRRGLLVRQTDKRLLVRLAYIAGRREARIAETWVSKAELSTVQANGCTACGCIAPDTHGSRSAEIAAIVKASA
jgi:hypothetical protein